MRNPPRFVFQLDSRKAAANLRKHKVSFREAMTVFDDPLSSTLNDDQHSQDEDRSITVGCRMRAACYSSFTPSMVQLFA